MLTNTLWLTLYVALAVGIGAAGYYLGYERGQNDGAASAELSDQQALYLNSGVETLTQLGYTWDGETWATPSSSTNAAVLAPTATRLPDRTSCAEIDGTPYRSSGERNFFLTNCVSVTITPEPSPECGEPVNPWCFDLFPGELITNPPVDFCRYFLCVESFWSGSGYVIKCQDGLFSKAGGAGDTCTENGGVSQPLYAH